MAKRLHIFVGAFGCEADALAYTQAQWAPEPAEGAAQAEIDAWEDDGRIWPFEADLGGLYLDEDFIETIFGRPDGAAGVNWDHLASLISAEAVADCRDRTPPGSNTLALVMEDALGGFDATPRSTPRLSYLGDFESTYD